MAAIQYVKCYLCFLKSGDGWDSIRKNAVCAFQKVEMALLANTIRIYLKMSNLFKPAHCQLSYALLYYML